ncbi:MAG TPA: hypothetical protein QF601_01065 [Dehalococcoidia bacterium]|nr:hypothetical protein [Dehalococcoidia bacterium]
MKNSESNRREKFIKNLKSRPVSDNSSFLTSRPLGCGLGIWVLIIMFIGIVLVMIFTAISFERANMIFTYFFKKF